jgi:hypothetical protein
MGLQLVLNIIYRDFAGGSHRHPIQPIYAFQVIFFVISRNSVQHCSQLASGIIKLAPWCRLERSCEFTPHIHSPCIQFIISSEFQHQDSVDHIWRKESSISLHAIANHRQHRDKTTQTHQHELKLCVRAHESCSLPQSPLWRPRLLLCIFPCLFVEKNIQLINGHVNKCSVLCKFKCVAESTMERKIEAPFETGRRCQRESPSILQLKRWYFMELVCFAAKKSSRERR